MVNVMYVWSKLAVLVCVCVLITEKLIGWSKLVSALASGFKCSGSRASRKQCPPEGKETTKEL